MRATVYRRTDGRWEWRIVARNGQVVATSGGQGYERRSSCVRMLRRLVAGPVDLTAVPQ